VVARLAAGLPASGHVVAVGVGSAPNRYLLDELAVAGRGSALVLEPGGDAAALAALASRLGPPALRDVALDWRKLQVSEVVPGALPALWPGEPRIVSGRLRGKPRSITLHLRAADGTRRVFLAEPAVGRGRALGRLWARRQVAELVRAEARGSDPGRVAAITALGLRHHLVTPYTAFVAVAADGGGTAGRRYSVPVAMPAGSFFEAVFGEHGDLGVGRSEGELNVGGSAMPAPTRLDGTEAISLDGRALALGAPSHRPFVRAGVGLGVAALAGEPRVALGLRLGIGQAIGRHFTLGVELDGLVPVDGDRAGSFVAALARLAWRPGRLGLSLGVGPSLGGGGVGLELAPALELALPLPGLAAELRYRRSLGADAARDAVTAGVGLSF
jgi:hypothetical protein